ncbi:ABC transporter substrate-binding protein [Flavobacterium sp.]
MILIDQLNTSHFFASTPNRIVSLVPSQTELLFDLGLQDCLVGVTKFCVHPLHLKATKIVVGGTKTVNVDKIRVLQPDIIICNKEENTKEIVELLSPICPVWVTNIFTIEDNIQMITDFGTIFNKQIEAQHWNYKIKLALADFKSLLRGKLPKKVAYFIWSNPYMVAGNDTFINELLLLNNFENIYKNRIERYPEIDLEIMRMEETPDIVLLSSEPFPFTDQHAFEINKYTHNAKTIFVDGEMFSWYGSRVVKAFDYFKKLQSEI